VGLSEYYPYSLSNFLLQFPPSFPKKLNPEIRNPNDTNPNSHNHNQNSLNPHEQSLKLAATPWIGEDKPDFTTK